jgi:hypothetical protein
MNTHTCCICGHKWVSIDRSTDKKVRQAARVNKAGPYCSLCHHFEMADRHARSRGYQFLYDAMLDFVLARSKSGDPDPAHAADAHLVRKLADCDPRRNLLAARGIQPAVEPGLDPKPSQQIHQIPPTQ